MVFSTTNLFKGIPCPYGEECTLTNCIFSHDLRPKPTQIPETTTVQAAKGRNRDSEKPATKRRKVTYETLSQKPPSKAEQIKANLAASRTASAVTSGKKYSPNDTGPAENSTQSQPDSLRKPITPPSRGLAGSTQTNSTQPSDDSKLDKSQATSSTTLTKVRHDPVEQLNPRLVANDPVGHAKRTLYLKHIHGEMSRLNTLVQQSQLDNKHLLVLTERDLVKMALDEEENFAKNNPTLYANLIKNRIATYRKITIDDWTKQVKASFEVEKPKPVTSAPKQIPTDLTPDEETLVLPHLVADQSKLGPYGYIPVPPTDAQAAEAAAAVETSQNYEICDRCSNRFQLFPNRNELGLLGSNGPCKYHPNRKVFPQKTKGDAAMGLVKEAYFPCCSNVVGSPGCTEAEYHVFKASTPARLAAVMPFTTTPENRNPSKDSDAKKVRAVSFDCEMGYTTYGMELIRLTAVAWPSGKELVDVLVRPLGIVIDLNSRFSGVWPEAFTNAIPYDLNSFLPPTSKVDGNQSSLRIVSSPEKARELLCRFLTPDTPLIGHAIDNDLNAVRLCHPTIVDSVLLYPHPRGLPMRYGLKMLASRHLGKSIQTGGDRGHDSLEDAQATGDLVRVKVGEKWKIMRATGWNIVNGRLNAPAGYNEKQDKKEQLSDEEKFERFKTSMAKALEGSSAAGKKRRKKFAGADGGSDVSTEDEEVLPENGEAAGGGE